MALLSLRLEGLLGFCYLSVDVVELLLQAVVQRHYGFVNHGGFGTGSLRYPVQVLLKVALHMSQGHSSASDLPRLAVTLLRCILQLFLGNDNEIVQIFRDALDGAGLGADNFMNSVELTLQILLGRLLHNLMRRRLPTQLPNGFLVHLEAVLEVVDHLRIGRYHLPDSSANLFLLLGRVSVSLVGFVAVAHRCGLRFLEARAQSTKIC
mmetsp:Transcript_31988/g.70762  ORF Transcript_31988/g.70762 Transcript_31988/m.70762 type:complete len:208 (-) Transcript_31988:1612-2235(-)